MFSKSGSYNLHIPEHYMQSKYYTFSPSPLCKSELVKTDTELALLLAKAHRLIGILEGMSRFIPNINIIESMLIKREAVFSCRIDGFEESFEEAIKTSEEGNKMVSYSQGYIKAVNYGKEKLPENHFTNQFLCEIHKNLMADKNDEEAGQFRKTQTFFGPRVFTESFPDYNPPAPDEMGKALIDFEKYINCNDEVDVLTKAALIHYQFETIHPFISGNGKLGRILNGLFISEKKILSRQLLCISKYLWLNKIEYFDRLKEVQRFGNFEQWVKFFVKALISAAEDSINIINRLLALREKTVAKIMTLGKLSRTATLLLEYLEKKPIIDIKTASETLNLSFNTVSKSVESLREIGILKKRNDSIRYRYFAYEEYLNILDDGRM